MCFNLLHLDKLLQQLPNDASLSVIVTESGRIVDHTAMEYLHELREQALRENRSFELVGLEHHEQFTSHALSARMHDAGLVRREARLSVRAEQMRDFAATLGLPFNPSTSPVLDAHGFIYLRRGDLRQQRNVIHGVYRGHDVHIFDYSHTAAPDHYVELRHTVAMLEPLDRSEPLPDFVLAPGHYLKRYLVDYDQHDAPVDTGDAEGYRVYTRSTEALPAACASC